MLEIIRKGPIKDLNPTVKLICLIILLFTTILTEDPLYLFPLLVFALIISIPYRRNLYHFRYLLILLFLFACLIWPIFLRFKAGSFAFGLAMAERLVTMVIFGIIYASVCPPEEITSGLEGLFIPFRISFAVGLSLRLVPRLFTVGRLIKEAQIQRGLDLETGNPITRLRRHIPLLLPIFMTTMRSAHRLTIALEAKGFGNRTHHSYYLKRPIRIRDIIGLTISTGVFLLLLFWR